MSIPEQAGKVATSTVETFRSQPALLFLTIINLAFLVCAYFIGQLVLRAYNEQQDQMHERYTQALVTLDRCIDAAFQAKGITTSPRVPSTEELRGERLP